MTARRWKLSQLISLAFVASILAFAVVGAVATGEGSLMSDAKIIQPAL